MDAAGDVVRVENVWKKLRGKSVLNGVSFDVGAGEGFCILGRSGMGKSVTLRLMIGLIKPDSGHIYIYGNDVPHLNGLELAGVRKKIGFLFQDAALFDSINVRDNIAFPLRRHTRKPETEIREIVHEKLKEVDLEGHGDKMPAELSGGMRKRAGLARALTLDPDLLLVDEPSSGLDRITASEIDDLLLELKQKRKATLVVVTHDIAGARKFADRFGVLHGGKILATGSADQLAASEDPIVRQLASESEATCLPERKS